MKRLLWVVVGCASALTVAGGSQALETPREAAMIVDRGDYVPMPPTVLRRADGDPVDSVVTPNGKHLLVVGNASLRKLKITKSPAKVIGVSRTVYGDEIGIGDSNRTAYVGNDGELSVVAVDRKKPRVVRTLNFPADVTGIRASGNGRFLYVAYGGTTKWGVRVYSVKQPRKPKKIATAKTAWEPYDVAVGLHGKRVITANRADTIAIINTARPGKPRTLRKKLKLSFAPESVTAAPGARYAYVWGGADARLAKIDLKKLKVVKIKRYGSVGAGWHSDADVTADGRRVAIVRWVVGDEMAVTIARARNLKTITSVTGAPLTRTLAVSKRGGTSGRVYLGMGYNDDPDHRHPPLVAPLRQP